jgi:hypothetical protein
MRPAWPLGIWLHSCTYGARSHASSPSETHDRHALRPQTRQCDRRRKNDDTDAQMLQ